ncbi:MAG: dTDP-4-dehydrorhamnose reductase [bacterium]
MRCLVTGARGMLGTELVSYLRARGEEVVEWDLPAHDISDIQATINGIHRVGPEVVFHLAAWTDVDGCEQDPARAAKVNTQGTWAVALGVAETGGRMLYVSTDYVFDGRSGRPYRENDEPGPLSVYGRSKLMGEKAVERTTKHGFIVRTGWLYGRNGKNFVDTIRSKAAQLAVLEVVDDQVGAPTLVTDILRPLHEIGRSTRFDRYHVTNSGNCSWYELAREVVRLSNADCEVRPTSSAALARPAPRPACSVLENRNLRRRFGIALRDWREALEEYIAGSRTAAAGR